MPEESTTPDLVELVRAAWEAGNRRDLDAVMSLYAPNSFGTGRTSESVRLRVQWPFVASLRTCCGPSRTLHAEVEEIGALDDRVVIAVVRSEVRPGGSQASVQSRDAVVYELVDGLVLRLANYRDIDEARAAAERLAQERG